MTAGAGSPPRRSGVGVSTAVVANPPIVPYEHAEKMCTMKVQKS